MSSLTQQRLAVNAYRTLGLPSTASQADIDQAARRMRIWPDPNHIPPTPWDLPWLGPIARSRTDIEQAVSRLGEPPTRVAERLWWFHRNEPAVRESTPETLPDAAATLAATADPAGIHDAALAELQAAILLDPDVEDSRRWQRVLGRFTALAGNDDYLDFLLRAENDADFEKRASPDEVASAVQELPSAVVSVLAEKAQAAVGRGDLIDCGRLLEVLRGVGPLGVREEGRILDRMEDVLDQRCSQMDGDVRPRLRCERQQFDMFAAHNEAVCRAGTHFYNTQIEPVLSELHNLCANDPDRSQRVRAAGAKALGLLGLGWVWAGDFVTADRTFARALEMARGTALEPSIRADMEENATRARRQRLAGNRYIPPRPQYMNYQPTARPQQYTYSAPRYQPASSGSSWSGSWRWLWIVVVVVGAIGRMGTLYNRTNSNSSSPSRGYNTPGYNPSYTPPTYTPPTYTPPTYNPPTYTPPYRPPTYTPPNPNPVNPNYPEPRSPGNPSPYTPGRNPGMPSPGSPSPGAPSPGGPGHR